MNSAKMKHGEDVQRIPGFLLWQVSKLWQRHLANTFKELELSNTQVILLGNIVRLAKENNNVTQTMLSEVTKVDVMTTSAVIRSLERRMFIRRLTHPEDKRAYFVVPTENGVHVIQQALKKLPGAQREFFTPIETELETFILFMQKLIKKNSKL